MRVLHTAHTYWPLADGVSVAMQHISEGLAARGHDVTVATGPGPGPAVDEHNEVKIRRFEINGNSALGFSGESERYVAFARSFECELMLNYAAQICTTDLLLPYLDDMRRLKVLVPCGYSGLNDPAYKEYFARMPEYLSRYDEVIYLSDCYQDRRFAEEHGLSPGVVIGNGADEAEFGTRTTGFRDAHGVAEKRLFICVANLMPLKGQKLVYDAFMRAKVDDAALVFLGSEVNRYVSGRMRTAPGRLETLRRRKNILRYERERLVLPSRPGTTVLVLAGVPRDLVVGAYHEADLFLFGSQVECAPLVILEAMASRTPWISTPVGNVADLAGGIVVADENGMAEQIDRLSGDALARSDLAERGHDAWKTSYTWEAVADKYDLLYREMEADRAL
jgi:glycosyltransferase involved in cell wall biosynthesis